MKIKIEGKAHIEGVSKKKLNSDGSGKAYNFNQVHYLAPARGVEGLAAQTIMLDPNLYPIENIHVGQTYDVEFDRNGYVVNFDLVVD